MRHLIFTFSLLLCTLTQAQYYLPIEVQIYSYYKKHKVCIKDCKTQIVSNEDTINMKPWVSRDFLISDTVDLTLLVNNQGVEASVDIKTYMDKMFKGNSLDTLYISIQINGNNKKKGAYTVTYYYGVLYDSLFGSDTSESAFGIEFTHHSQSLPDKYIVTDYYCEGNRFFKYCLKWFSLLLGCSDSYY